MYNFPVALQLYSVRDNMEADFEGTLKAIKEMGYNGVEFAGIFGKSGKEVKEICEKIGLTPISAHVPYLDMVQNPDLLKTYAEIGCKYVVIPYLNDDLRPDKDKFGEFIENTKKLGEKANSLGMKLCYHNHDFEFEKIDGEYVLDRIYREIPADLLLTQIDTCWTNVGGENPADYIRKYTGRADLVHLKDFTGKKSENMYALIGIEDNREEKTSDKFELRPLGKGLQDFPSILAASKDAGAKWVIIEQDEPSMGKSRLECAEISINYFKTIN